MKPIREYADLLTPRGIERESLDTQRRLFEARKEARRLLSDVQQFEEWSRTELERNPIRIGCR